MFQSLLQRVAAPSFYGIRHYVSRNFRRKSPWMLQLMSPNSSPNFVDQLINLIKRNGKPSNFELNKVLENLHSVAPEKVPSVRRALVDLGITSYYADYLHLRALAVQKDLSRIADHAEYMLKQHGRADDEVFQMTVDPYLRTSGLSLADRGALTEILRLFGDFGLSLKYEFSWNLLVQAYCKVNMSARARAAFASMLSRNLAPDLPSFDALISVHCNPAEMSYAESYLMEKQRRMPLNVFNFNRLVEGYIFADNFADADRTVKRMMKASIQPDFRTHLAFIRGYCLKKRPIDAQRALEQAESEKFEIRLEQYLEVLRVFCIVRDWRGAGEFVKKMKQIGFDTTAAEDMLLQTKRDADREQRATITAEVS